MTSMSFAGVRCYHGAQRKRPLVRPTMDLPWVTHVLVGVVASMFGFFDSCGGPSRPSASPFRRITPMFTLHDLRPLRSRLLRPLLGGLLTLGLACGDDS